MTIALDTEIVASRFDTKTGLCSYTIERNGKRWTVDVHLDHFEALPKTPGEPHVNKQLRRNHLAKVLEQAMQGPCDAEKESA